MAVATQQEADRVLLAYENAKAAKDYKESIVLEMQQIETYDYCMVWTNHYPIN